MEAVCAPFSFEAALNVLQCHGELIAVPRTKAARSGKWYFVDTQHTLYVSSSLSG